MKNLLLTGPPRCGKTRLIEEVVKMLPCENGGFYTGEIKEGGRRVGFSIKTLDGKEGVLSHVGIKGRHRVGRYGVNMKNLEGIAVASLLEAARNRRLIAIDEIGRMELLSPEFREAVLICLDCPAPVLGTIMEARNPFADAVKTRSDVQLIRVTQENRDNLPDKLVSLLTKNKP